MTPPLDPQVRELIAQAKANIAKHDRGTTHWDGCWRDHPRCLAYLLADRLDALFTRPVPQPDGGLTLEGATRAVVERAASYKCRCTDAGCRPCLACEATNVLRPPKVLAASRPDGETQ